MKSNIKFWVFGMVLCILLGAVSVWSNITTSVPVSKITLKMGTGSGAIASGSPADCTQVGSPMVISGWQIIATDGSTTGSVTVEPFYSTYAGFPSTASMVGTGTKPTLTSQGKNTGTCGDWSGTLILPAESVVCFNISGGAVITKGELILFGTSQ